MPGTKEPNVSPTALIKDSTAQTPLSIHFTKEPRRFSLALSTTSRSKRFSTTTLKSQSSFQTWPISSSSNSTQKTWCVRIAAGWCALIASSRPASLSTSSSARTSASTARPTSTPCAPTEPTQIPSPNSSLLGTKHKSNRFSQVWRPLKRSHQSLKSIPREPSTASTHARTLDPGLDWDCNDEYGDHFDIVAQYA